MVNMTTNGKGWNPYLAGALTGIVIVLSVWLSGKYAGASTSFVRSAGMIEKIFNAEHVAKLEYFVKQTPKIEWQWMFVVGILAGAFISAMGSGSFKIQAIPSMWQSKFGSSTGKRALFAFSGGIIAMFGARLAGG